MAAQRAGERRLRVWSAAASTGQEAYSIAMLLTDWLAGLPGWSATVVATDLSEEVLTKARTGRYSQLEVNRGLPAPLLVKHFVRAGTEWQLSEPIRRMVEFRALNLAAPFPAMPPFDIVFCRNVLIYFDTDTRRQVLSRITKAMRPDGALLLGAAESTLSLDTDLERVQVDRATYHRLRSSGRTS
jgi:chemotaxis protein methyltransferase CheR